MRFYSQKGKGDNFFIRGRERLLNMKEFFFKTKSYSSGENFRAAVHPNGNQKMENHCDWKQGDHNIIKADIIYRGFPVISK